MDALDERQAATQRAASRLPSYIKFPALTLVSLGLSAFLYTVVADYTGPELASVSRNLEERWQLWAILGWKLAELFGAWYLRYDYMDLGWLTLLSNVPHYFLLNTFYGVDNLAALIPLAIDVVTIAIPFALFRGPIHARNSKKPRTANQLVAQDAGINWTIAAFAASLYTLVIYLSYSTWLTVWMTVHFDGLKTLEKAHTAVPWLLVLLFLPVGYGATQFIFVPAIGSAANPGITDPKIHPEKAPFNPETATFSETLAYNLGLSAAGFSPRAEILFKRTAILAVSSFANSFMRSYLTIEGTDLLGTAGWSSVWAVASALAGLAFAWVGDE
ncbi:hypothetical protein CKM354_000278000 [Cercospora kikuchii]|uniref:Uncharacterized protein n=1 Tax=Cercospora kikuchii TaxID=84275 RepID=A0A9P3CAJ4_9PEZI|nr:uncharacterized protein CKM354_000278000 [Cercospora kikuchii]GIZ39394.1 hypothetical protein CKM354_000278000 [Cercospora kikuchii]